ncbi:RNA recognition motif domain [Trypanosoma melophagium]|uniref:RNA recognition motif domain n=1 Tax=Trypanosoma melophagium TaxID=715481 RepID=UPI00351AA5DF|nr:RNA recognition motif domain [Trypanosoma melophagium]
MPYQNLFVAKLPRNLNDANLEQIFSGYSPVSAKVMLDAATGKSKGFGFVLFNTEEEGYKAYEGMNRRQVVTPSHLFHLCVFPSKHSGKAAFYASNALYIRNIPMSVPQQQVEQFLASFGTLLYCAMREDHYGSPVWVVYAEYDCLDCSANALRKLHGNSQHFGNPPVMVKYADNEEAKRERRRRREEGKSAPARAPRSARVVQPPQSKSKSKLQLQQPSHSTPQRPQQQQRNSECVVKATNTFLMPVATAAATGVVPVAAVHSVDSVMWSQDTSTSSPVESNGNSNSFGAGGIEVNERKNPAVVYRHNPYAFTHLDKEAVRQTILMTQ